MTIRSTKWGEAGSWLRSFLATPTDTDTCIPWPFAANGDGYGLVNWDGQMRPVPRVVLAQLVGPPPAGRRIEAAHAPGICHNRLCINPRHLRWATSAENHIDQLTDDTHRRGQRHPLVKLTEVEVLEIYRARGMHAEIGAQYGVARSTVSNIKHGHVWAWLTGHERAAS